MPSQGGRAWSRGDCRIGDGPSGAPGYGSAAETGEHGQRKEPREYRGLDEDVKGVRAFIEEVEFLCSRTDHVVSRLFGHLLALRLQLLRRWRVDRRGSDRLLLRR